MSKITIDHINLLKDSITKASEENKPDIKEKFTDIYNVIDSIYQNKNTKLEDTFPQLIEKIIKAHSLKKLLLYEPIEPWYDFSEDLATYALANKNKIIKLFSLYPSTYFDLKKINFTPDDYFDELLCLINYEPYIRNQLDKNQIIILAYYTQLAYEDAYDFNVKINGENEIITLYPKTYTLKAQNPNIKFNLECGYFDDYNVLFFN